ncbi:MAG: carbohydrate kinase [Gammaproteobacteria bacterium]|nr:MAG: carbohydrate kinase [Gammaproteobacteria bacterium]
MARILLTGIAVLDIINRVPHYPQEDEELRAIGQRRSLGGNAANTAALLAELGHEAWLCATLGDDPASVEIEHRLQARSVNTQALQHVADGQAPTSFVTLNAANGSRTIVHWRDLPELSATHFLDLPLEQFDAFHFEGRNVDELIRMLQGLEGRRVDQPVSIEIEKPRPGIEALFPLADVLIVSRAFARARGFDTAPALLDWLAPQSRAALIVVPWGEAGAWARTREGRALHEPALAVDSVVDTLGAGDSFNAGLLDALAGGASAEEAVQRANRLAGLKVRQEGFAGLAARFREETA